MSLWYWYGRHLVWAFIIPHLLIIRVKYGYNIPYIYFKLTTWLPDLRAFATCTKHYHFKTHLKLKSRDTSLVHITLSIMAARSFSKFCTEHCRALYESQNDWETDGIIGRRGPCYIEAHYCDVIMGQPHDCLLKRSFRRRSKKTLKLRVTGLCAGNSSVTGEFPAQMASNAENVSIGWRHHETHFCFGWRLTPGRPEAMLENAC